MTGVSDDLDWRRLGKYVQDRRTQLVMTQPAVQAAGGPAVATIRLIETAGRTTGYRGSLMRKLEVALRWHRGSVDAILRRRAPTDHGSR